MINFIVITLFPNFIKSFKKLGIIKKAINKNIINIKIIDIKKYYNGKIDDKQYGGNGVVIKPEVIKICISKSKKYLKKIHKIIYLTPRGKLLNTNLIKNKLLNYDIIIVCGRYKGIDERIILTEIDEEISIGDYVLSGGELPSMLLIESVVRLIPNVINENSYKTDSFYSNSNLLGYSCYTKPLTFNNINVPNVLLSGNHEMIYKWRFIDSIKKTILNRPDLININNFNDLEKKMFYNFIKNIINNYEK